MLLKDLGKKNEMKLQANKTNMQTFIEKFISTKNNAKNVLYIHTPFCINRCKYCVVSSKSNYDEHEFQNFYNHHIFNQVEQYNEIFEQVSFDEIYFGGGTPTLANANQLSRLFSYIPSFSTISSKNIEASPSTLREDHIALFKDNNFSYISVGIQSLNEDICKKQNRDFLSKKEFNNLSKALVASGLYFNYDLICFLDRGDIRDIPQFLTELDYILKAGKPSSVTIQQAYGEIYMTEKTAVLIDGIKNVLIQNDDYLCINSMLDTRDIMDDCYYQANYRLVSKTANLNFYHYLWNKYPTLPVPGYNILSLGYGNGIRTVSNAGKLVFIPSEDKLSISPIEEDIDITFKEIRQKKGLKN